MRKQALLKRPSTLRRHKNALAEEPAREARNGRLKRKDWIRAGQNMLRERGISGLKLFSLTSRLGVSTGSFYHHFSDFEEYLGAVAQYYSADLVQGLIDRTMTGNPDPTTRMRRLAQLSLADKTFDLDAAMRIWATMDERAAVTVERAEKLVLNFLGRAFEDLGFQPMEAALRSRILLSVNLVPLLTTRGSIRRNLFRRTLDILVSPGDSSSQKRKRNQSG